MKLVVHITHARAHTTLAPPLLSRWTYLLPHLPYFLALFGSNDDRASDVCSSQSEPKYSCGQLSQQDEMFHFHSHFDNTFSQNHYFWYDGDSSDKYIRTANRIIDQFLHIRGWHLDASERDPCRHGRSRRSGRKRSNP